jgi:predicted transcriptional regulator
MSTTIRVSEKTRDTVHDLARNVGVPMAEIVERAIEQYRRQHILDTANAQYAALRADPEAWAEIEAERALWDATLLDGLEDR